MLRGEHHTPPPPPSAYVHNQENGVWQVTDTVFFQVVSLLRQSEGLLPWPGEETGKQKEKETRSLPGDGASGLLLPSRRLRPGSKQREGEDHPALCRKPDHLRGSLRPRPGATPPSKGGEAGMWWACSPPPTPSLKGHTGLLRRPRAPPARSYSSTSAASLGRRPHALYDADARAAGRVGTVTQKKYQS